jgi:hypothetical protein
MIPKQYTRLIAGILLLLHACAQAHTDKTNYHPFYGGFSWGYAAADVDCDRNYHGYDDDGSYGYTSDCDGMDNSYKLFGGSRFHENLAFEISIHNLGKLDNERDTVTTTAETTGVNFSLLGIIPIEDNGYFYGKVGMMTWETDYTRIDGVTTRSEDDGTDVTYGAGVAVVYSHLYEMRLEIERLNELDHNFTPGGTHVTVVSFGCSIHVK